MNNKFLDKVVDQIISETRVIDDKVYTPFSPFPSFCPLLPSLCFISPFSSSVSALRVLSSFISHCKDVYSLNEQEIDYVWWKYKEGITTLINDKELSHQEKGWWFITQKIIIYMKNILMNKIPYIKRKNTPTVV